MATRIRILAGCFALAVMALLLAGTTAHATPRSGTYLAASVSAGSPDWHGHGAPLPTATPTCQCYTPTSAPTPTCQCYSPPPAPTPTCQCYTPPPAPTPTCTCHKPIPPPPPTCACTPTPTPTSPVTPRPAPPVPTTAAPKLPPAPLVTASTSAPAAPTGVPSGGANTGGGGSIGSGTDVPMVAGGSAVALASAGLGLFAYRRWRGTTA